MIDVFLERRFQEPLDRPAVLDRAAADAECLQSHQVEWLGGLLAADGRSLLCWFRGDAADAVGAALAQAGIDTADLWPGTIHGAAEPPDADPAAVLVLVSRRFDAPASMESLQALEFAHRGSLDDRQVRYLRSFFSADRCRMLCLYQAPDAVSVRLAQQEAGMPMERVWAVEYVHPTHTTLPPSL